MASSANNMNKSRNNQTSDAYTKTWPCIVSLRKGIHYALCTICQSSISVRQCWKMRYHLSVITSPTDIRARYYYFTKHLDVKLEHVERVLALNVEFVTRPNEGTSNAVIKLECLMVNFSGR